MPGSTKHAATCAAAVASSSSPIRSASTIRRPHPLQRRVNYSGSIPRLPGQLLGRDRNAPPHAALSSRSFFGGAPLLSEIMRRASPLRKHRGRSLVRVERIRDPQIAALEAHLRACCHSEPLGGFPC